VKSQETIKLNISNKTKNISGVDRVEQLRIKASSTHIIATQYATPMLHYKPALSA